jgi:hypothetical protein
MSALTAKIKHEFLEMLPPTIFFFVTLHIIAIIRALMVKGTGISLPTTASVLIASLILGKAVLLANMLPFINRFPEKPLIWNVAWKTVIYTVVACIIHYLERLYDYWKEAPSIAAANHQLLAELNWPRFWAVQILLLVLILNYCVFAELSRIIGPERMKAVFIGPLPPDVAGRPNG